MQGPRNLALAEEVAGVEVQRGWEETGTARGMGHFGWKGCGGSHPSPAAQAPAPTPPAGSPGSCLSVVAATPARLGPLPSGIEEAEQGHMMEE